ncbi:MAG TPA: NRDE family protein [Myxococcota bacterium]|nr:NRDE family protein [Myxococcota bacterium]
MCTLILLDRVVPQIPVIAAANRDEFLTRPAAPPLYFAATAERPGFVAPQDLDAGGTWMGVNSKGVFVGLTNRPVAVKPTGVRSRGLLVLDALRADSAAGAAEEVDRQRDERYAPFNLLATDGRETWLTRRGEDGQQRRSALGPGMHVICNRDPEDPSSTKVRRIKGMLADLDLGVTPEELASRLFRLLGAHPAGSNPLENPCVHTSEYGTRSSSVLMLGAAQHSYWFADGAPCETKYRDFTVLLDDLRASAGVRT